ncbi:hypothetical protein [Mesorhizobium sp. M1406]|uniref:hypothetical protein n=1 Tax=Mesorhizobium sp. M1406 TaxID=2957099 RepID=UPI003336BD1D
MFDLIPLGPMMVVNHARERMALMNDAAELVGKRLSWKRVGQFADNPDIEFLAQPLSREGSTTMPEGISTRAVATIRRIIDRHGVEHARLCASWLKGGATTP